MLPCRKQLCLSMKKPKDIQEGIIEEELPDAMFRIKLRDGRIVLAKLSGKMRMYHIKTMLGDRVRVELSPYDETRGRIVFRGR